MRKAVPKSPPYRPARPSPDDHAFSWDDTVKVRGWVVCGKCRRPKVEHPTVSDPTSVAFWEEYSTRFRAHILPSIVISPYMLAIGEADPENANIMLATELGLMLLLDKPLVLVVPHGITVSPALRRAAAIVLDDFDIDDHESHQRVLAAFAELGVET